MRCLARVLCGLLFCYMSLAQADEAAGAPPAKSGEAVLSFMNRPLYTFRATLGGTTPALREARAERRLNEVQARELRANAHQEPVTIGSQSGVGMFVGDVLLFTVLPEDADPENPQPLPQIANDTQQALNEAFAAYHAQHDPGVLLRGLAYTTLALVLFVFSLWALLRLRAAFIAFMQRLVQKKLSGSAPWVGYLMQILERVAQIIIAFIGLGFAYLWFTYSLRQFPLTRPLGERLGQFLLDLLARIGEGAVATLPNVVTLVVVFLITRTITQSLQALFQAVYDGRIVLPGLHRETLGATRRIVVGAVWALGFTFAYPYIPGSQSDVFKGLSVLFGFMLTLGSAGLVSQLMSGMTLVYSRALRKGDLVQVGDTVGNVEEVGSLSTKIITLYNEEITIPNAVLVGNQIRNLSRLHEQGQGLRASTKVTIGYDTPWRQVQAMLLNAAGATEGLLKDPAPFVLQRALNDFYIEYELLATLADPQQRPFVLSALHQHILDEFNTHGVQIMSPHFTDQPEQNILVKKGAWVVAPAVEK